MQNSIDAGLPSFATVTVFVTGKNLLPDHRPESAGYLG
jgi:hypothetical protein